MLRHYYSSFNIFKPIGVRQISVMWFYLGYFHKISIVSNPSELEPFIKMNYPRPHFRVFSPFQTNISIFITNKYEIMSIQCWDLNPWPLEHVSFSITTWPWLPPYFFTVFVISSGFVECHLSLLSPWWLLILIFITTWSILLS